MKTLVTGAEGMVGSHLVEALYEYDSEVIGTYYRPTVNLKEINPKIKLLECDVRYPVNVEKIILDFLPDEIYHLAAQSYPAVSWERPYETMDINIGGTLSIFESVKRAWRMNREYDPVVVVACSSAEYGQSLEYLTNERVKETEPLLPLHPYGVSKVGQDLLSYQYWKNFKIRSIRARIFNTTGPRKVNDVTSDFTKRAVKQELAQAQKPTLRVGNLETKRAIMDVRDLTRALMLLAKEGKSGEVYNISSEFVYEIKEIVSIIEAIIHLDFILETDPHLLRPADEKIIVGDITKLKRDTEWKQNISLETTISDMISYWRRHPDYL